MGIKTYFEKCPKGLFSLGIVYMHKGTWQIYFIKYRIVMYIG